MSIVFNSYINATQLSGLAGQISALLVTVTPRRITQRHHRGDLLKLGIAKRGGSMTRFTHSEINTLFVAKFTSEPKSGDGGIGVGRVLICC